MSTFTASAGTYDDLDSLIELARSVEHLFGPMVGHGFEGVLQTNIQRGSLIVARDVSKAGTAAGGLIFDERESPFYHISWLAVFQRYQGRGAGRLLLSNALMRAKRPCEIEVVTFGPDKLEGLAARHLYESFGFQPDDMLALGPEGGSRQRYRLMLDAQ